MALCGLDLREYRKEAVLVHWVDPKSLLRFLLHCHSYGSYWQRGIKRGMWPSRCNLPCTSWPSAGGLALIFWRTVGVCFVLHTGRVMSGVCEFSSMTRLWVSLSSSPESGGACALCWSMLKWPPSWGEVTQPQGCRQWICYCCWLLRGYTYASLALWLYLASLPVTHHFLGHHTDLIHVKFRSINKSRNNNYVTQNSNENAFYLLPFHVLSYHFWCRGF